MKFKIISPKITEVTLSKKEVDDFGISFDSLDSSNPQFRAAVMEILEELDSSYDYGHKSCNLCVEASKTDDGGLNLVFTFLGRELQRLFNINEPLGPVVFHFSSHENLSMGCTKIAKSYLHRIYKSSLFSSKNSYFLIVYPLDTVDSRTIGFLSEYGSMIGTGDILASYIAEHGKLLIKDNAIDIWSELGL